MQHGKGRLLYTYFALRFASPAGRPPTNPGYGELVKELEWLSLVPNGAGAAAKVAGLANQVAGALHAEPGGTLLAQCYAYHGTLSMHPGKQTDKLVGQPATPGASPCGPAGNQ